MFYINILRHIVTYFAVYDTFWWMLRRTFGILFKTQLFSSKNRVFVFFKRTFHICKHVYFWKKNTFKLVEYTLLWSNTLKYCINNIKRWALPEKDELAWIVSEFRSVRNSDRNGTNDSFRLFRSDRNRTIYPFRGIYSVPPEPQP